MTGWYSTGMARTSRPSYSARRQSGSRLVPPRGSDTLHAAGRPEADSGGSGTRCTARPWRTPWVGGR